jgi:hypothetical protein
MRKADDQKAARELAAQFADVRAMIDLSKELVNLRLEAALARCRRGLTEAMLRRDPTSDRQERPTTGPCHSNHPHRTSCIHRVPIRLTKTSP